MPTMSSLRVLITGAGGNLGRKLVAAFLEQDWCSGIIGTDRAFPTGFPAGHPRLRTIEADLRHRDAAWLGAVGSADAVVHLAAQNPYPDASWEDAAASFDMTAQLLDAAAGQGLRRFVFASSNHVMGGYKETGIATTPGALTAALPPWPGTRWRSGDAELNSTAYATAKLMGERLCAVKAASSGLTAVALRIGWCQPGDNRPATLSATGMPTDVPDAADPQARHDLAWFRAMWLSNRDFVGVVRAALLADASRWPAPAVVANAMSDNAGMPWDIGQTSALLGYRPQDDAWRELAATA